MAHEAILQIQSWNQKPGLMGESQEGVQVSSGAEQGGPLAGDYHEGNPPCASVEPPRP